MSEHDPIASRLCAACGLCCNGVLFQRVYLQPGDSAGALSALGLRVRKKKGRPCLLQPCPAHREQSCSIYPDRPARCRLFECRLLQQLDCGEIVEAEAMEQIAQARRRVDRLNRLLDGLARTRSWQPLFKRCESALAEPPDSAEGESLHERVAEAREDLRALLDGRFRVEFAEGSGAKPEGAAGAGGID